jgi:hypothetical protein
VVVSSVKANKTTNCELLQLVSSCLFHLPLNSCFFHLLPQLTPNSLVHICSSVHFPCVHHYSTCMWKTTCHIWWSFFNCQWYHPKTSIHNLTRFAWWWQDLHAIKLLRAHIGEWTITRMLDYWRVMCFTDYWLNWNSWIWIPFPIDSDCTLLCAQVDRTRYSSIAAGNNCIVQLCKCVSLHLKWALWIHPVYL